VVSQSEHFGQPSGEAAGEHSPGHRWLTYSELGRIRGIGRESAVKLAQRKRWRRVPGNDGEARIAVPQDWLAPAKEPSGDHSPEQSQEGPGEHSPELSSALKVLEVAIVSLTDRAIAAEKRADWAEGLNQQKRVRIRRSRPSKSRAAGLMGRNRVQTGLKLTGKVSEASWKRPESHKERLRPMRPSCVFGWMLPKPKPRALNGRQSRPWRLSETLRQAEAAVQKADHDRTTAVAIADEAVRAAEELRQAQASRAGQGRWQRLRAAWRGD
jgi:hypothetical protein